jgi:outer membrane protein OmpA-like peptidoglycan-associated protein
MKLFSCLLLVVCPLAAQRPDARGSSDHRVLSRYPGSSIQSYNQQEFAEYQLALGVKQSRPDPLKKIEGKVTKINYVNPAGRSSLEIYRNYEQALQKAGFQTMWSCAGRECGQTLYWTPVNGLSAAGSLADQRYLTVQGKVDGKAVTVAMAVSTTGTTIHVIEQKAMDSGLVVASAAEMAAGIDRDGHISVYAIYFDTGKADLRPESKEAIEQIAQLLKDRPKLQVLIVGHTDSTGALETNMKLSRDRAAAVVAALTGTYSISAARLSPQGAGPLAPVATNRTEEGRARNRRVDLVER